MISIVPDLAFKQDVHYSYFNTVRGVYDWIDLTLFTDYDMINVKFCKIIPPNADNVNDHRPLRLPMEMHVPLTEAGVTIDQSKKVPFTYWNRQMNNKRNHLKMSCIIHWTLCCTEI